MPRRREVPVRVPVPDPVFNSTLVSKFINCMMWDGKKSRLRAHLLRGDGEDPQQHRRGPAADLQESGGEFQACRRGEVPPRRRRELPGADRGPAEPPPVAGAALADRKTPAIAARTAWPTASATSCWKPRRDAEAPSRRRTTSTAWPRPTRPSRTSAGSPEPRVQSKFRCPAPSQSSATATSASPRTSMPARPPRRSASCTTPGACTAWVRCMTAPRPWTTWSRSRSAESRSPRPPRPASGATTRSTSSTRRAMSTSPPRSSARCACSTAPSRCSTPSPACSRSRRRSGARPTSTRCRASRSSTRWIGSAPTSITPCRRWWTASRPTRSPSSFRSVPRTACAAWWTSSKCAASSGRTRRSAPSTRSARFPRTWPPRRRTGARR